ncbi:MAG TPA: hypothetical protein VLT36_11340, partial [Candidatus Dormibacteraeota bacterium]|nr:hypothetical protein [Candidatus Dormibacteraeota bacterium]
MRWKRFIIFFVFVGFIFCSPLVRAADFFVSPLGSNVPPFAGWTTAATNIQTAIDAASAGDTVWVTNGVYGAGGKVMAGDLTNRVALDKALTVRSVNGRWVTVIDGGGKPNGSQAVRCAWLTNGATLMGFTVQRGSTRNSGDTITLQSGGGIWCSSSAATLFNCLIISNAAASSGIAAFQGALNNCAIVNNLPTGPSCCYSNVLINCTVAYNSTATGINQCRCTNSIIFHNNPNYSSSTFSYSCTTPSVGGDHNISTEPQLPDHIHLANGSPCKGAGTNLVIGTDIDGDPWSNPPSIGCDEWQIAPRIISGPVLVLTNNPIGFRVGGIVAGQEPLSYQWLKDGVMVQDGPFYSLSLTTNLSGNLSNPNCAGSYQLVASNSFGVITSVVAQLVVHFVDVSNSAPSAPYLSWATAANRIQDAVDIAGAGEAVLVTNGVYSNGGKIMGGDLSNRVVLDKPIILQSITGPTNTIIQGAWDPARTNGLGSIRCAWLTNGAGLSGFTLFGGSTRAITNSVVQQRNGAGVWGSDSNVCVVANCIIATNAASDTGGGAYQVALRNCLVIGNMSLAQGTPRTAQGGLGGGAGLSTAQNCLFIGNMCVNNGGGAYRCTMVS